MLFSVDASCCRRWSCVLSRSVPALVRRATRAERVDGTGHRRVFRGSPGVRETGDRGWVDTYRRWLSRLRMGRGLEQRSPGAWQNSFSMSRRKPQRFALGYVNSVGLMGMKVSASFRHLCYGGVQT